MMFSLELSASTGNPQIDSILQGLVGIYQAAFSQQLRSLYVVGSYSDASAVPGSDLDVGAVFSGPLTDEQLVQFCQLNRAVALVSTVRLDCGTVNPQRFTNGIPAGLKAALVVYGENVFAELPIEPVERALRRGMSNTFHSLYILRQRDERLTYPLNYPDAEGEFYGYERWGTYLGERTFGPGVRSLVTSVTLMASCLVMLQSGQHVASKRESVLAYQRYVGDIWTEFVQQVYTLGKETWHYQLPERPKSRRQLRGFCAQMLNFENHFLTHCRTQVLDDLTHSDKAIQELALYRLKRIAYPGQDYLSALTTLKTGSDSQLAEAAETILDKLHRAASS